MLSRHLALKRRLIQTQSTLARLSSVTPNASRHLFRVTASAFTLIPNVSFTLVYKWWIADRNNYNTQWGPEVWDTSMYCIKWGLKNEAFAILFIIKYMVTLYNKVSFINISYCMNEQWTMHLLHYLFIFVHSCSLFIHVSSRCIN